MPADQQRPAPPGARESSSRGDKGTAPAAVEELCRLLAAGSTGTSAAIEPDRAERVLDAARAQGLAPVLHQRLGTRMHEPWTGRLREEALRNEARELARQPVLRQLLAASADRGIDTLLMKGAALAYSLYDSPGRRPRADTDVLVRTDDIPAMREVLAALGYSVPPPAACPATLHHQFSAFRRLGNGLTDAVDVHWHVNNRQQFARLFEFDELRSRALPLPALGHSALGLGLTDSLLLACLHRVGHLNEGEPERLVWLYDIHLLVEHIDGATAQEFIDLMRAKRLTSVCNAGIARAAACFGTRIGPALAAALERCGPGEQVSPLLDAGPLKTLWLQFRAQPGWRQRLRLTRELFLPPGEYMRRKYPESRVPLWWLYIRRGVEGMRRRLRKS